MDYREMRKLLKKVPRITRELADAKESRQAILDEIALVDDHINPQGQKLTGMPHSFWISNKTEEVALKLITLRERYRERLTELSLRIEEMERFLSRIDTAMLWLTKEQRSIIRLRYWEGKTMQEVAYDMRLARQYCYRLEWQAFETMGEHL